MTITQLLEQRISCNYFDPTHTLDAAQISELIRLATLAPSAYNGQNWRFIAVQSPEGKQQVLQHAYGQQKVADAAVCFIVCGRLDLHTQLAQNLAPSLAAGIMSAELVANMVHYATEAFGNQPQNQRDEAIRSASLSAMSLILAAQGMGLASCPMTGFDAAGVAQTFGLSNDEIPVMLIPVGRAAEQNWPQKPRRAVADVLEVV
ncbi:nitroreductase family protein [Chitinibacter sp. SCUT-21]|uniref:nitroreductase family protein n=1 Tax=Chitinibacter sp. SCUT-21 TaxID=2970891 RepID=UPI0035A7273C